MRDWLEDYGWLWILIALLIGGLAWLVYEVIQDDHQRHAQKVAACERMWAAARTSADTISVLESCVLPEKRQATNTVVMPMPVIIR